MHNDYGVKRCWIASQLDDDLCKMYSKLHICMYLPGTYMGKLCLRILMQPSLVIIPTG